MAETPATVLLVDDRADNLMALSAVLEPLGIELVTASSGQEALSRLLEREISAIILDVQMPDMDGFETAELLKSRSATRHIPIIFLTAISSDVEHELRGYDVGGVDYISKPFDPKVLRAKVRALIETTEALRSLPRVSKTRAPLRALRPLEVVEAPTPVNPSHFSALSRLVERRIPAGPSAPRTARTVAAAALEGVPEETLDAALLLVSELVTNAVRHARSSAWLRIDVGESLVRVEVADRGPGLPELRPAALTDRSGRGLMILRGFADRCGYTVDERGKTVWFEIELARTGR